MALTMSTGSVEAARKKNEALKNAIKRGESAQTAKKTKASGGRGGKGSGGAVTIVLPAASGSAATRQEDPYWEQMRQSYESAYADALKESEAALERSAAAARTEAERSAAALDASYAGLDRQLYRDYMEHRRTLPQELAAQGYTGGVSESARLRLHNGYEEALAENRRSRLRQLTEVEAQRAQAEDKARQEAAERSEKARQTWQEGILSLMRERHSENRADELRHAETLAKAGDFSGYRALGWTEGEIGCLSAVWAAKNPEIAAAVYGVYA